MDTDISSEQPPPLASIKTRWPTVLGIIAIVFGGFGLLGALLSPLLQKVNGNPFDQFEALGIDVPVEIIEKYDSMIPIQIIGTSVIAVLLVAGGIVLLRRNPFGPTLLKIWSVTKITGGGFLLYQSLEITRVTMDLTMQMAMQGADDEMGKTFANVVFFGSIAIGIVMLLALPVFFLIWFGRSKIKKETAEW